jgi:hypothetical protein
MRRPIIVEGAYQHDDGDDRRYPEKYAPHGFSAAGSFSRGSLVLYLGEVNL